MEKDDPGISPKGHGEIKNILLLGETGVGKSTFINSFVNYLEHTTFTNASTSELACLIPLKFTVPNENYEDTVIEFGSNDDCNEDTGLGNSSTQGARGYLVPFEQYTIRLIDTPGIGDPRGVEQDDTNFENVLSYISQFKTLHGICFFLKPNVSVINAYFKFSIVHLLSRLDKSAASNIIFVFTNSRGTFYRPGETLPLLKKILKEIKDTAPHVDVPCSRENLFCVDNEALKCLIAMKKGIYFDDEQTKEFEKSWRTSYKTCREILAYICGDGGPMQPHELQNTILVNRARKIITDLLKPLADVCDLIQDNLTVLNSHMIKLQNEEFTRDTLLKKLHVPTIKLEVKQLAEPVIICTSLKCTETNTCGELKQYHYKHCDSPCDLKKENIEICHHCGCSYTTHMYIYYESRLVQADDDTSTTEMIETKEDEISATVAFNTKLLGTIEEYEYEKDEITKCIAKFAYYLKENSITAYNDVHIHYLNNLIEREKLLGDQKDQVIKNYTALKLQYEEEKKVLDDLLQNSRLVDTKAKIVNDSDIKDIIKILYNLKHTGPKISQLHSIQENKFNQSIYAHEFTYPNLLKTTFVEEEAKNICEGKNEILKNKKDNNIKNGGSDINENEENYTSEGKTEIVENGKDKYFENKCSDVTKREDKTDKAFPSLDVLNDLSSSVRSQKPFPKFSFSNPTSISTSFDKSEVKNKKHNYVEHECADGKQWHDKSNVENIVTAAPHLDVIGKLPSFSDALESPRFSSSNPAVTTSISISSDIYEVKNEILENEKDKLFENKYSDKKKLHDNSKAKNISYVLITNLSKPLVDICDLIQDNLAMLETHKKILQDNELSRKNLLKKLHIPTIELEVHQLTHPMTVCTSSKCSEIYTCGESKKFHYKQKCHNPCGLRNVPREIIGPQELLDCSAMNGGDVCQQCGCLYTTHMHIYYESKVVKSVQEDVSTKDMIKTKQDEIIARQVSIKKILSTLKEYEREKEEICKCMALFSHYLKKNSTSTYRDPYVDYLDYLIEREELLGNEKDQERIKNYTALKFQYEQKIKILDDPLQNSSLVDAKAKIVNESDIEEVIKMLYNLKHTGSKISQLHSIQKNNLHQSTYAQEFTCPNFLQTNYVEKATNYINEEKKEIQKNLEDNYVGNGRSAVNENNGDYINEVKTEIVEIEKDKIVESEYSDVTKWNNKSEAKSTATAPSPLDVVDNTPSLNRPLEKFSPLSYANPTVNTSISNSDKCAVKNDIVENENDNYLKNECSDAKEWHDQRKASISINNISKPLVDICDMIQDNLTVLKSHEKMLQNINLSRENNLLNKLFLPVIEFQVQQLTHPVTVCTSSKCSEIYTCGEFNKYHYKQKCHNPCRLKNVPKQIIGTQELVRCSAMNGKVCRQCGCLYTTHMHIFYELRVVQSVEDVTIKNNIKTKQDKVIARQVAIQKILTTINEYECEKEEICQYMAKFSHYLNENSISTYSDPYMDYLDYLIEREQLLGDQKDQLRTKNYTELKFQYEKEKNILDDLLQNSRLVDANAKIVNESDIEGYIKVLYNLKYTGPKISQLHSIQENKFKQSIYAHEFTYPNLLKTTFVEKEAKNICEGKNEILKNKKDNNIKNGRSDINENKENYTSEGKTEIVENEKVKYLENKCSDVTKREDKTDKAFPSLDVLNDLSSSVRSQKPFPIFSFSNPTSISTSFDKSEVKNKKHNYVEHECADGKQWHDKSNVEDIVTAAPHLDVVDKLPSFSDALESPRFSSSNPAVTTSISISSDICEVKNEILENERDTLFENKYSDKKELHDNSKAKNICYVLITNLSKPLVDICDLIQDNLTVLKTHKRMLQDYELSRENLIKKLHVPTIELEVKQLTNPVTVCTFSGCSEIYTCGELTKYHYKQRCHNPCGLINVPKEIIGSPLLKRCSAMNGNVCQECGCMYTTHMHIYYESRIVQSVEEDVSTKNLIKTKQDEVIARKVAIKKISTTLKEYDREKEDICKCMAKLSHYLEENSISTYKDPYVDYIIYIIEREKLLGDQKDEAKIKNYTALKFKYEQEKKILDDMLHNSRLIDAKATIVNESDIEEVVKILYNLKHTGSKISQLHSIQEYNLQHQNLRESKHIEIQANKISKVKNEFLQNKKDSYIQNGSSAVNETEENCLNEMKTKIVENKKVPEWDDKSGSKYLNPTTTTSASSDICEVKIEVVENKKDNYLENEFSDKKELHDKNEANSITTAPPPLDVAGNLPSYSPAQKQFPLFSYSNRTVTTSIPISSDKCEVKNEILENKKDNKAHSLDVVDDLPSFNRAQDPLPPFSFSNPTVTNSISAPSDECEVENKKDNDVENECSDGKEWHDISKAKNIAYVLITNLSKPLVDICDLIQDNLAMLETHKKILQDNELSRENLLKKLHIPTIELEVYQLTYPMTVCTSSKCSEIYTCGESKKFHYKQKCHNPCSLTNVPREIIGPQELLDCLAMKEDVCRQCGCLYTTHMHIYYESKVVKSVQEDVSTKDMIKTKQDEVIARQDSIKKILTTLKEYEREKEEICKCMALFSHYLKENSTSTYRDPYVDYLDYLMEREELLGIEKDQVRIKNYTALKFQYAQKINILDDPLQNSCLVDAKAKIVNESDIEEIIKMLYNLKHTGSKISQLHSIQKNNLQQSTYAQEFTSPNFLQTNYFEKATNNILEEKIKIQKNSEDNYEENGRSSVNENNDYINEVKTEIVEIEKDQIVENEYSDVTKWNNKSGAKNIVTAAPSLDIVDDLPSFNRAQEPLPLFSFSNPTVTNSNDVENECSDGKEWHDISKAKNIAYVLITNLSKPLVDIRDLIQDNLTMLEAHKKILQDNELSRENLLKNLHVKTIELDVQQLTHPVTVCTSPKCIDIYSCGELMKFHYKQRCHNPCKLINMPREIIGPRELINCAAMCGNYCRECGCKYTTHMHVYYESTVVQSIQEDVSTKNMIKTKQDEVIARQVAIEKILNTLNEYEHEKEEICKCMAKFSHYLKENSISTYRDPYVGYVDYLIEREELLGHRKDEVRIKNYTELKLQYEEEKKVLDDLLQNSSLRDTKSKIVNESDIKEIIKVLYNLKHTGPKISQLHSIQENISQQSIYAQEFTYPNLLKTTYVEKEVKNENVKNGNSNYVENGRSAVHEDEGNYINLGTTDIREQEENNYVENECSHVTEWDDKHGSKNIKNEENYTNEGKTEIIENEKDNYVENGRSTVNENNINEVKTEISDNEKDNHLENGRSTAKENTINEERTENEEDIYVENGRSTVKENKANNINEVKTEIIENEKNSYVENGRSAKNEENNTNAVKTESVENEIKNYVENDYLDMTKWHDKSKVQNIAYVFRELEQLRHSIEFMSTKFDKMRNDNKTLHGIVKSIKEENVSLKDKVIYLEGRINSLEQEKLSKNI